MAVKVQNQLTHITVETDIVIVTAPAAGKTRVIPPGGIVVTNLDGDDAIQFDLIVDDGTQYVAERVKNVPVIPDAGAFNQGPIHLQPGDDLKINVATIGLTNVDVVASFLEES